MFAFRRFASAFLRTGALRFASTRAATTSARTLASPFTKFQKTALVFGGLTALTVPSYAFALSAAETPIYGVPGTSKERTFIAIKPDGVQRHLVGEIIRRFEAKGYKLVGLKLVNPTEDFAREHYADLNGRPFFPGLVKYFSSGPVIAMVWEGRNAISGGRKLVGATNPDDSAPGSIRGDLCVNVGRNIIHGSDSADSAQHEISLWFKDGEVADWSPSDYLWVYEK